MAKAGCLRPAQFRPGPRPPAESIGQPERASDGAKEHRGPTAASCRDVRCGRVPPCRDDDPRPKDHSRSGRSPLKVFRNQRRPGGGIYRDRSRPRPLGFRRLRIHGERSGADAGPSADIGSVLVVELAGGVDRCAGHYAGRLLARHRVRANDDRRLRAGKRGCAIVIAPAATKAEVGGARRCRRRSSIAARSAPSQRRG